MEATGRGGEGREATRGYGRAGSPAVGMGGPGPLPGGVLPLDPE